MQNPTHNLAGDFALEHDRLSLTNEQKFTFSGIGLYRPRFFEGLQQGKAPLAPLLRQAISRNRISGQLHSGKWTDVGTPERLELLNVQLRAKNQA